MPRPRGPLRPDDGGGGPVAHGAPRPGAGAAGPQWSRQDLHGRDPRGISPGHRGFGPGPRARSGVGPSPRGGPHGRDAPARRCLSRHGAPTRPGVVRRLLRRTRGPRRPPRVGGLERGGPDPVAPVVGGRATAAVVGTRHRGPTRGRLPRRAHCRGRPRGPDRGAPGHHRAARPGRVRDAHHPRIGRGRARRRRRGHHRPRSDRGRGDGGRARRGGGRGRHPLRGPRRPRPGRPRRRAGHRRGNGDRGTPRRVPRRRPRHRHPVGAVGAMDGRPRPSPHRAPGRASLPRGDLPPGDPGGSCERHAEPAPGIASVDLPVRGGSGHDHATGRVAATHHRDPRDPARLLLRGAPAAHRHGPSRHASWPRASWPWR